MTASELESYLPLGKSWIIRMGLLDLIHGRSQIKDFLNTQKDLSDDLLALERVVEDWHKNKPLDVGESGTLYRFLLFASWALDLNKKFLIAGTLRDRQVTNNRLITKLPQEELLRLDSHTSQWASAKVLLGDRERLKNPPHLLAMTYEAVKHWEFQTSQGLDWQPRLDRTIHLQAKSFLSLLSTGKSNFKPLQAEDYCFARALGLITKEEGEARWPALRNHESNRIDSMEEELANAKEGKSISSRDHRVIQAIYFWSILNKKDVHFEHPNSVSKTWPLFWEFTKRLKP